MFLKWKIGLRGQMVNARATPRVSSLHNKAAMGEAFSHQPICMHKKTHSHTHSNAAHVIVAAENV